MHVNLKIDLGFELRSPEIDCHCLDVIYQSGQALVAYESPLPAAC